MGPENRKVRARKIFAKRDLGKRHKFKKWVIHLVSGIAAEAKSQQVQIRMRREAALEKKSVECWNLRETTLKFKRWKQVLHKIQQGI